MPVTCEDSPEAEHVQIRQEYKVNLKGAAIRHYMSNHKFSPKWTSFQLMMMMIHYKNLFSPKLNSYKVDFTLCPDSSAHNLRKRDFALLHQTPPGQFKELW